MKDHLGKMAASHWEKLKIFSEHYTRLYSSSNPQGYEVFKEFL